MQTIVRFTQGFFSRVSRLLCGVLMVSAVGIILLAQAQPQPSPKAEGYWTHLRETPAEKRNAERWVRPLKGELFKLDEAKVRSGLAKVRRAESSLAPTAGTEVTLPMPDGSTARFKVVDSPVMAPELAAKFPEIRTYAGRGVDDPAATIVMDLTPAGLHAQILSPHGAVYVDPAFRGDSGHYVSYFKRDYRKLADEWQCRLVGRGSEAESVEESNLPRTANKTQSGPTLRKYRLAVAATGEYTAFHGGTVPLGQAAIVTAIARVNQVFESELAVRLELVANNNLLVYTSAGSDPYTNNDGELMLDENQANIDAVIGNANYDIGHVFSTGGGGIANWQSVCNSARKAQGVTGLPSPIGDPFYIDYVAHEIGHQFGGDHTFNSETGSCGGGTRWAPTAFEPGSGSTILAYAGICSPNNLQPNSDPYFHAGTLDQIQSFLNGSGGGCAVNQSTGNSAPTVNGGPDRAIPANTPFELTATGSDPNSNPLTYCWEEMDLGPAAALTAVDDGEIPLFRSFNPSTNPTRYFPRLSSVLANTNWNQEKRPSVGRTMALRVTVRDGLGGVADDDVQVTVVGGTGPFVVSSPNTALSWSGSQTVTWNVAGTTSAPINASGVNILLSTNGGQTFTILLATNVPNNGSAGVVLPDLISTQARIKVQGAGNIFYDVSDVNFSITSSTLTPLVQSQSLVLTNETCLPTNGVIDPYEMVTVTWALTNIGGAPTTNLVATLLATNGIYFPSGPQDYGVIPAGGSVARSFSFVPAGVCGGSVTGLLALADNGAPMGTASQVMALGAVQTLVSTQAFANASPIIINDFTTASPYPSTISVSGVTNVAAELRVRLLGITHPFSFDINALLVGPGGQNVALMTYAGSAAMSGVNLTFANSAANPVPFNGAIPSGSYFPSDYEPLVFGSIDFPSPAPVRPYGDEIQPLVASPNGIWSLYIYDTASGGSGSVGGGWRLEFVSTNNTLVCCNTLPPVGFTSVVQSSNMVGVNWQSLPGINYQVQSRTNLAVGSWVNFGSPIPGTGGILGTNDLTSGGPTRFYRVQVVP